MLVFGDWNQDIRSGGIQGWKDQVGLRDAMMDKTENTDGLPSTYQRGRLLIDTIMATGGVVIEKAAYLPFGNSVGDCRAIFVNISLVSVLGANLPPIQLVQAP